MGLRNTGELWRADTLASNGPAAKQSHKGNVYFFNETLRSIFFKQLNLSQDVEDVTLINKVTPWDGLLRNSKAKNTFLKVLLFNCLMFVMIQREHFNLVSI